MLGARLSGVALFDIKSAFPTATCAWMRDVFEAVAMPRWISNAFFALLLDTECEIIIGCEATAASMSICREINQ